METLYLTKGYRLAQHERTIQVVNDENQEKYHFPIEKVRHIVCLGSSTITTKLLELCGRNGVRLSIFNEFGVFRGAFEPTENTQSGRVLQAQVETLQDPSRRMGLAQGFVKGSGTNALNLLKKRAQDRPSKPLSEALIKLEHLVHQQNLSVSIPDLMGREGLWRHHYYQCWGLLDPRLDFGQRVRRPPNNPINCLISFLNQMVYATCRHELFKTHLNETVAFLHSANEQRSSLSLDLSEIFKPLLSDRLIMRAVMTNVMKPSWFNQEGNVCLLSDSGRVKVVEMYKDALNETYQGKSYRERITQEAFKVERYVLGMDTLYHPFIRKS